MTALVAVTVKGRYPKRGEAADILKKLIAEGEVKLVNLDETLKIKRRDRIFVVRPAKGAMKVFLVLEDSNKAVSHMALSLNDGRVTTQFSEVKGLPPGRVKLELQVSESVFDAKEEAMKDLPDATEAAKAFGSQAFNKLFCSPLMRPTDAFALGGAPAPHRVQLIGDRPGEVYEAVFANTFEYEELTGKIDRGQWLRAVYSILDQFGLNHIGDRMTIGRFVCKKEDVGALGVGNEILAVFTFDNGDLRCYRLTDNEDKPLKEVSEAALISTEYDVTHDFYVVLVGLPVGEDSREKAVEEPKEWIPHHGQFVYVKDDKDNIMYRIHDFDQVTGNFLLALADSTRGARQSRIHGSVFSGRRSDPTGAEPLLVEVHGSRLKPHVLKY